MMIMPPEDVIRRTFLGQPKNDGERHRTTIVKAISNHHKELESNSERITFICSFDDYQYEDIYV